MSLRRAPPVGATRRLNDILAVRVPIGVTLDEEIQTAQTAIVNARQLTEDQFNTQDAKEVVLALCGALERLEAQSKGELSPDVQYKVQEQIKELKKVMLDLSTKVEVWKRVAKSDKEGMQADFLSACKTMLQMAKAPPLKRQSAFDLSDMEGAKYAKPSPPSPTSPPPTGGGCTRCARLRM